MNHENWRLPDGVDELLPPAAWALEQIRRKVLDVFAAWGFDYVEPPLIEYLDALLVGSGGDLDLQTLKAVDQRSGRMLGVRADMTSQAARIDAHSLPVDGIQRLCYAGTVVHANPMALMASRVPCKAGAEIFGSSSLAADAEVIALMNEVLHSVGVDDPVLVLGHMGIYHALVATLELSAIEERSLFAAVQSKSETDIAGIVGSAPVAEMLIRLPTLMGASGAMAEARSVLQDAPQAAIASLDALEKLTEMIAQRCPEVSLRFDIAELSGYGYHNGPVFSAFHADLGHALARGGRYDGIGSVFGRDRPATGFDVSLKQLVNGDAAGAKIWAPWAEGVDANTRDEKIAELRAAGDAVQTALDRDETPPVGCSRILTLEGGVWSVSNRD